MYACFFSRAVMVLPMMAKYGETENDRLAAAARLEVLKKKK